MKNIMEINDWEELRPIVEKHTPSYISLYHVSYDSSLDEKHDIREECVTTNSVCPITEEMNDGWQDSAWEEMMDVKRLIIDGISEEYNLTEDEEEDFADEWEDYLKDYIYDKDTSDPVSDIIGNTREEPMYYSLGIDFYPLENYFPDYSEEIERRVKVVKNALNITNHAQDKALKTMVAQASYGGELRIYFFTHFSKFIQKEEPERIRFFGKCWVAIVDNCGGSGDETSVDIDITLPFERKNVGLDEADHYSFTHDICGMVRDWCKSTRYAF